MQLTTLRAQLEKLDRQREQLRRKLEQGTAAVVKALPAKVGLKSVDALIGALLPYASPSTRARLNRPAASVSGRAQTGKATPRASKPKAGAAAGGGRGRVYPEAKRAAVRQALTEGKLTTKQISNQHGIPQDTIKKWKRNWGMTKHSKSRKGA